MKKGELVFQNDVFYIYTDENKMLQVHDSFQAVAYIHLIITGKKEIDYEEEYFMISPNGEVELFAKLNFDQDEI